ncbi:MULTISPECIES: SDR family NAD(P)-dependent oxidoreductase [Polaromonas]|uniref:SDR family NAD(P)-dependent oxidoreductase n=1 Tax=Polaromonas aquatica TaxID=332657 RepID=A0ABW1U0C3_9BURK
MTSLTGKTVVITGAASGIGEALAHAMAAQGARLLLADVDAARLASLAEVLQQQGITCLAQACDVSQASALDALAERALRELGGADILINNAGVALVAPAQSLALHDAHWLMNINFWGVVYGCRAFTPQLQARPGSVIVNLSSVFAMVSLPTQSIYNASKAAVRAFSDALREELREENGKAGVRVLCVHPGGIRTRLVEQARLGDITAIADSPQALHTQFRQLARTSPDEAATAIVRAIRGRQTRLLIGADARLGDWLFRMTPAYASAWFSALARWGQQRIARPGAGEG